MRIASGDTDARGCARQIPELLPRRLRPPSFERRNTALVRRGSGARRPVLAVTRRYVTRRMRSEVINGRGAPDSVAPAQFEGLGAWYRRVGGIPHAVCAGRSRCFRAPVAGARRRPCRLLLWRWNLLSGSLARICRAGGRTLFPLGDHPGSGASGSHQIHVPDLSHLFWMRVEPALDLFENVLALPTGDATLLVRGAAVHDHAVLAGSGPVAVQSAPRLGASGSP